MFDFYALKTLKRNDTMGWLKGFSINIAALTLAAGVGAVVTSQVIYVYEIQTGAIPIAPLIRGFFVSILVAAAAPHTGFWPRFLVFTAIYLVDLLLSVLAAVATAALVNSYFNGDAGAAKPWTSGGAVIPFITGIAGLCLLRRYRRHDLRSGREILDV